MKRANELPIINPPLICYAHHAYPLTSICANPDSQGWLFSNYIQLFWEMPRSALNFAMSYPATCLFQTQCIADDYEKLFGKDICALIMDAIDSGYYVLLQVDEFFIPHRDAYDKYHKSHEILFWGYTESAETFKSIGYSDDFQYKETEVPYQNVHLFRNLDEHAKNNYDVILMKYKNHFTSNVKIDQIILGIENYLNSINNFQGNSSFNHDDYKEECFFGLNIYKRLGEHCEEFIALGKIPDVRFFHVLYEHKKLMRMRCEYLVKEYNIETYVSEWEKFEKKALSLRNRIIKEMLLNKVDERLGEKIKNELENFRKMDVDLMSKLREQMQKLCSPI